MSQAKLIKRYANRKLYDTKKSSYVTLDEIADMVRNGEDVRIVDNKSQEDMTAITLAQIIFEQEKKTSRMPLGVLRSMIQSSGEALTDFLQKKVTSPVSNLRGEMEKTIEKVFHRTDGNTDDDNSSAEEQQDQTQAQRDEEHRNVVRAFMDTSTQALEEWQHQIDMQVQRVLSTMTSLPTAGTEFKSMKDRIAEIEDQLKEIERPAKEQ